MMSAPAPNPTKLKPWLHLGGKNPEFHALLREGKDFCVEGKKIALSSLVIAQQVHDDGVHVCKAEDSGAGITQPKIAGADALITTIPGQYLLIRTADCYPILLEDKQGRVVAAIHSGREGTRLNIVGKTIRVLSEEFGIQPVELWAHVGAGICAQHYQVDETTWQHFRQSQPLPCLCNPEDGSRVIDLRVAVFRQLIEAGLPFYNIEQDFACTLESSNHHSHRRDGGPQRQINLIGLEYEQDPQEPSREYPAGTA